MQTKSLKIGHHDFTSRLFIGTGKFANNQLMSDALDASGSELITVALRRVETSAGLHDTLIESITRPNVIILPNTSGARTADEAIYAAQLAREALQTNWIKLEVHPDPKYLLPDAMETLRATEQLVKEGFIVMPYIQADPVLCKRLEEVGAPCVMPLGAPIGSNMGLTTRDMLRIIIAESTVPVVVDAGIGRPSHAAEAMELGADAVLVNTAISTAADPVAMSIAFRKAVEAGRSAYEMGLHQPATDMTATATSPLQGFFD